MTPRPSAEVLEDILAVALRIERILTREADNATVDAATAKYYREMAERHKTVPADMPPIVPAVLRIPGMPDPPLPPVRPQTTWGAEVKLTDSVNPVNSSNPPRTWMHGSWIHRDGFSMVGP